MRFMPRFSVNPPMAPQTAAGIVWGEFVANQILAARANDGSNAVVLPPGGSSTGVWVTDPSGVSFPICYRNGDLVRCRLQ